MRNSLTAWTSEEITKHQPDTPVRFMLESVRNEGKLRIQVIFTKETFGFDLSFVEANALRVCLGEALKKLIVDIPDDIDIMVREL